MIDVQLTQLQWIELSREVKDKLIDIFHIPRTEPTKINQGLIDGKQQTVVLSDGHSHKDLSVITVKAMQEYLGNYNLTDFYALFNEVLNRISTTQKVDSEASLRAEKEIIQKGMVEKWRITLEAMKTIADNGGINKEFADLINEYSNVQKTTKQGAKKRTL